MALSGKDETEGWSSNAKKRQEHFEAETERILMDTYNSLYKCQEFVPQVCNHMVLDLLLNQPMPSYLQAADFQRACFRHRSSSVKDAREPASGSNLGHECQRALSLQP